MAKLRTTIFENYNKKYWSAILDLSLLPGQQLDPDRQPQSFMGDIWAIECAFLEIKSQYLLSPYDRPHQKAEILDHANPAASEK